MKKILLLTSILFFAFSLSTVKAQTIDTVIITSPILCYGEFAAIEVQITQTAPSTPLNYILNFSNNGAFYFQIGQAPLPPNTTVGVSQNFTNLVAGFYLIELKDSLGVVLDSYNIYVPQPFPLTVAPTQAVVNLCNGDCDAAEKLTISGGIHPYTITVNGQTNTLGYLSGDTTYVNLCADVYNVTISDSNGCPAITSFTITEPLLLIPNGSIVSDYNGQDISCFGEDDGEILAAATGGTLNYTFSLDGGAFSTQNGITGLSAGTYIIAYLDSNGCDTSETFTLTDPPVLSGALSITQQVSCNGVSDGIITFIVNNVNIGTPGYQYSIDGGATFQSSNIFTGLAGGQTHTIIVKDANNCEFNASIFLSEPTKIVFNASSLDFNGFGVSCNGFDDGQIVISSPSGGVPIYSYSIDGGATYSSTMIYNAPGNPISAGAYVVMVKDNNDCTNDTTIIITEPLPFSITATETSPISCFGDCDGEITVDTTNGVGVITYSMVSFPPSQTTNVWDSLCAGSYTINATDENGCIVNTTITLIGPSPWVYTVDSIAETCGLGNGQASISVTSGGVAPLAYLWDDPVPQQITATATNLVTGMYEVRVTDINGCTFTEDVLVEEINITLALNSIAPCNALNDGSAEVIVLTGIPSYSYQWGQGSTPPLNLIVGANSSTITGLSAGYYWVTVTDLSGCQATDSIEIPSSSLIDVTLDSANSMLEVACFGDPSSGITVIATGGIPNTYQYYIPFTTNLSASPTFVGLYAGTYAVYAIDANQCSDSVVVTITEPDQLVITTSSQDVGCNGGADGMASVDTVYGGTAPYFYLWSTGEITSSISNLTAGTYTVQVTDVNGCITDPPITTFIIDESPVLQSAITIISHATCAGSIQTLATGEMEVVASGGAPGYAYLWSTGATSISINFLMPGMYAVTITDQNNCIISDSAEILPGENPTVNIDSVQNVTCFGDNNGMMWTSATGGAIPYLFSADGSVTFVPSGTPFGPTGAATYFITVVDNLGCWDTATVHVTEPDLIQVSVSIIENVSCYDSANGELAAIVTGGTAPFSYSWNTTPIQTTQTATNLIAGFYSVTVTDTNLCPSAISPPEEITQPDSLYISALTFTAVLCNGENTGTATVVANGGTPNYSYAWSSGSPNDVAPNLIAGNYIIQISDINGCSRDSNIVVTQPDALSASYIGGEVSCIGGSDGWATVVVNGGVGPFNYLWEYGTTLATISLVPEDWYTVTITDANLCVLIDSVNILDPLQPFEIDSLIITEITCRHADNGTITVLATGGQLPYLYSNTNGQNMQSNIGFIGLAPNTYSMYVEDANGCWDTASVTFVNPDSLYIDNVVFSNVSCFGMADDTIHAINAVGGTPPYEYSVGIGAPYYANLASFNGYGTGTYSVNVLDAHNCGAQYFITITEPDELEVTITTSNWWFGIYQIQCNGDSSGTATISASAGVGPYIKTVLDINGDTVVSSTNSNISGLTAGTYTFVIMDANGCTYTETIIYTEPLPIIHNFIATQISCTDSSTGSIIDSVWGGVGNVYTYSYSWNTGDNTYSLDSLDTGTYIITVVDQIGCISIDTCIINDTNALTLTVTNWVDVSCYDYCDGLITVEASGGMPNINSSGVPVYSYQWDDILLQTDTSAIGLCVDNGSNSTTYSCVVTDIQECTATVNYTLIQPYSLNVTASDSAGEISCYLDNDGILTATATGGTTFPPPALYLYTWNNGTITAINDSLSVGSYVVVVEDSHGCMDTTEIYLSQPSVLSIDTIYETDVSCFSFGDGTITVDVDGGTVIGIQEYIYTWSNSFSEQDTASTATDLLPGIYTVTAEDANGCTVTSQSVYIDQPDTNLTFSIDVTDEICGNDGSATILVDGGTPGYTYEWNGPNGYTSTSSTADNLVPGSAQDPLWYTVDVTDTNGCTISGETFVNGIHEIFLPGFDTAFSVTVCLGEPVILPIQVKDSLFYVWMYDNDTIFSANSKSYIDDITVIPTQPDTNIYTLYFSNSSCTDSVKATILTPSAKDPKIWSDPSPDYVVDKFGNRLYLEAQIRNGESIDVFSDNMNLDTYQWHWSGDGETIQLATQRVITDFPAVTGWYYLEVYTEGCLVGFDSLKVVVGVAPYNAITPNADGSNDTWKIPGIKAYPNALIQVFNRWGSLVYEASGGLASDYVAWDGTSDGKELPVGTYYYIIDLKTGDDLQTGPITIIR